LHRISIIFISVKQLADLVHDLAATGDAGVDVAADLLKGEHSLRGCGVGARVAVDEDGGDALAGGLFDGLDGGAGTDQIEGGLDVELGHAGLLEDGVLVALALVVGAGHVVANQLDNKQQKVALIDDVSWEIKKPYNLKLSP